MQKICLVFFALFLTCAALNAQNNQILYDFDRLPQTLNLNPGAQYDGEKHFGIPFFSNIYFQLGASNKDVTYNSIVRNELSESSDQEKFRNLYNLQLIPEDIFTGNAQVEIFNMGYRLRNPEYYLSFGITLDAHFYASYPKNSMNLFFKGNDLNDDEIPELNDRMDFNELNFLGELVGVYYVGINKKVNENFSIGARFKLLSGSLNIDFRDVQGIYFLNNNDFGAYFHNVQGVNGVFNSYGLLDSNFGSVLDGASAAKDAVFLGGNYGVGFDFGLTKKFYNDLVFSFSVLDLDFLKYSDQSQIFQVTQDFVIEDEPYAPPFQGERSYWLDLYDKYYESGELPLEKINASYNMFRTPKIYASLKKRNERPVYIRTGNSIYRNVRSIYNHERFISYEEFGVQFFNEFYPATNQWGLTGFYARSLGRNLSAKVTCTADNFSYTNLGLGISTRFNTFNFYATADNLIGLVNYKDSNYQSFQFGMNILIP